MSASFCENPSPVFDHRRNSGETILKDNSALEAKWARGREVLQARLGRLDEEHYLKGAGLIIAGRKPYEEGST